MRRFLLVFILGVATLACNAKSMKELWAAIPDSLLPYVDKNHLLEMTDFIGMGLKGDVDNMFGSKSVMDTITADFIGLTLSESATMQIKRLPLTEGDSVLCVVKTWYGPVGESSVSFYDQQWQKVNKHINLADYTKKLLVRPDSISQEEYDKLLGNVDFTMVRASLNPDNDDLTLSISIPTEDKKNAERLRSWTKPMTLEWNDGY